MQEFPHKMGVIIRHTLEHSDFVICNFQSYPPEQKNLKIEPTRHVIKMDIHEVNGLHLTLEDFSSSTNIEWSSLQSSIDQLKQWRSSVQGSNWLWDR